MNTPEPVDGETRALVTDLHSRYGAYFDYGHLDAWVALFTEDGRLEFPLSEEERMVVTGRQELLAFGEQAAQIPGGSRLVSAHFTGLTLMSRVAPDRLVTFTPVAMVGGDRTRATAPGLDAVGAYIDDIVLVDGVWLFRSRVADLYGHGRLPDELVR
ncbi:nuclear transport factor 2 family protein [Jongsikchunia kroppenstedtii]|uniref:nuclear transport factor 2 family protein n=1 Tax=Jongsikchunia kroppenstedtii TaxID=1121721 RepID=UPI00036659C5|nr:nuclear transport factor 2 family protein [Jongsikchunia kroppenstedtii]